MGFGLALGLGLALALGLALGLGLGFGVARQDVEGEGEAEGGGGRRAEHREAREALAEGGEEIDGQARRREEELRLVRVVRVSQS